MTQRRWLQSIIDASTMPTPTLPWELRGPSPSVAADQAPAKPDRAQSA